MCFFFLLVFVVCNFKENGVNQITSGIFFDIRVWRHYVNLQLLLEFVDKSILWRHLPFSCEIFMLVDKILPLKQLKQTNWNGDLSKMSNCTQNFRVFSLCFVARLYFREGGISKPLLIIISCDKLSQWMKRSKGDDMNSDVYINVSDNWSARSVIKLNWKFSNETFEMIWCDRKSCHWHFPHNAQTNGEEK